MQSATTFPSPFRSEAAGRRTVTLRDGSRVFLRRITHEDKPRIAASFERLGAESRYRRFFSTKSQLSEAELAYLVDVDHHDHEAVVAIDRASGDLIGVARYIRSPDDPELAEIAVTVADQWQGRGFGRALLGRLTHLARRAGIRRFAALVQKDNAASLGLAADAGCHERRGAGRG
jgi:RimJ/RimL family protein N-acetyltransferase